MDTNYANKTQTQLRHEIKIAGVEADECLGLGLGREPRRQVESVTVGTQYWEERWCVFLVESFTLFVKNYLEVDYSTLSFKVSLQIKLDT